MTEQEIAAVHFYTQEGPFYPALNAALRDADRAALKPFFPYLKLVITALHKLPRVRDSVYRGIKLAITDLGHYKAGRPMLWWAFSSTTLKAGQLSNDMFLGTTGSRTMFHIQVSSGVCIQPYSAMPGESEVLLLPGTNLVVEDILDQGSGLTFVQMREEPVPGLLDFERPP